MDMDNHSWKLPLDSVPDGAESRVRIFAQGNSVISGNVLSDMVTAGVLQQLAIGTYPAYISIDVSSRKHSPIQTGFWPDGT